MPLVPWKVLNLFLMLSLDYILFCPRDQEHILAFDTEVEIPSLTCSAHGCDAQLHTQGNTKSVKTTDNTAANLKKNARASIVHKRRRT